MQYIQVEINHKVKYHKIKNDFILYMDILTLIKLVTWTPQVQPQVIALFLQAKLYVGASKKQQFVTFLRMRFEYMVFSKTFV